VKRKNKLFYHFSAVLVWMITKMPLLLQETTAAAAEGTTTMK